MTQEEYRRQEVRQTLDKVSKVEKVEKVERMETNTANKVGDIPRPVDTFAEKGSWTMTVTDHLMSNSENKDSQKGGVGENQLVEEETARRREAENAEMRKREENQLKEEEEKRKQLQQDLEMRKQAQFDEEMRLKEEELRKAKAEEMVRVKEEEEARRAVEEEVRLKREEVERDIERNKELGLMKEQLANQTLLQTSTPNKEEKHLVVSRHEISEEERQEMLRERQEFLRIPRQELEEEELGRTRKYFITQQEIVFYVKVTMVKICDVFGN